jgi:hypothetical protein
MLLLYEAVSIMLMFTVCWCSPYAFSPFFKKRVWVDHHLRLSCYRGILQPPVHNKSTNPNFPMTNCRLSQYSACLHLLLHPLAHLTTAVNLHLHASTHTAAYSQSATFYSPSRLVPKHIHLPSLYRLARWYRLRNTFPKHHHHKMSLKWLVSRFIPLHFPNNMFQQDHTSASIVIYNEFSNRFLSALIFSPWREIGHIRHLDNDVQLMRCH